MRKVISFILTSCLMCMVLVIFCGCSTKEWYIYENFESFLKGSASIDLEEIKAIDIDWVSGDVTVEVVEESDCIVIEETSRYKIFEDEELRYNLNDEGVLTIKFRASSAKKVFLTKEKSLHIKLPRSKSITGNLVINSVSADVYVNRAEPSRISVTNVSGETTIINSKSSIAEITSVSGAIKLKNSSLYSLVVSATSGNVEAQDLTSEVIGLKTVSGNIDANIATTPISINAESVSADINIRMNNEKGFTAVFESSSGEFSCGFETRLVDNKYVYLDGVYAYNFETVSGNVSIQKN